MGLAAIAGQGHGIIDDLNPEWLMLVGIAGAIPSEEYTLGDVVVATRLHDFTVRAAIEGNRKGSPAHHARH